MHRKKITFLNTIIFCFLAVLVPLCIVSTAVGQDSSRSATKSEKPDSLDRVNKPEPRVTPKAQSTKPDSTTRQSSVSKDLRNQKKDSVKKSLSNVLLQTAERVPGFLKSPVKKADSLFLFVKKNGVKFIILLVSVGVILMTLFFFRQRVEKNRFMTTTRLSVMDKEVQRACRHIENNFSDVDLSVDTLCTALVTGKAFLSALYQKELGMTVEDFIMQVRVNRAKIMLGKDSSIDIETLANKTGFCGGEPFRNAFVKMTGIDIENYRKSLLTEQNVM